MKKVVDVVSKKSYLVGKNNIKNITKVENVALIELLSGESIKVPVKDFTEYYLLINSFLG